MLSNENSLANEVRSRKTSMIIAFERLAGFWNGQHSWQTTKLVFQSNVYTSGLSAHECFKWTDAETQKLDSCWIRLARRAMAGKASKRCKRVDNEGHEVYNNVETMTNEQVAKYWGLCPYEIEGRCKRVNWYKRWSMYPKDHQQIIGAFFGNFSWELVPQIIHGRPLKHRIHGYSSCVQT